MSAYEPIDDPTPETGKPFLFGYRKFTVAMVWMALCIFVVLYGMLGKPSSGQLTLAIWVVGTAGFFCAFFVGGNVLAAKFGEFWRVSTTSQLTQKDETRTEIRVVEVDSQEDAAWKEAEKNLPAAPGAT